MTLTEIEIVIPFKTAMISSLLLVLFGCAANSPAPVATPAEPHAARLANPASLNCIQQNGKLEIVHAPDGGEQGICVLPDGKRCDEWEMFRGNCPTRTVNANMKFFGL